MELSRTGYVVLGMLKLGRRTGYEIKSLVDVSTTAHEARESRGAEFPLLALEWGIALHEFYAGWCARMEERLATEEAAKTGS
jgi:hypothetical protein